MTKRCGWVKMNNPLYVAYHDEEWGKPLSIMIRNYLELLLHGDLSG